MNDDDIYRQKSLRKKILNKVSDIFFLSFVDFDFCQAKNRERKTKEKLNEFELVVFYHFKLIVKWISLRNEIKLFVFM